MKIVHQEVCETNYQMGNIPNLNIGSYDGEHYIASSDRDCYSSTRV